jgi:hypothetical protein
VNNFICNEKVGQSRSEFTLERVIFASEARRKSANGVPQFEL